MRRLIADSSFSIVADGRIRPRADLRERRGCARLAAKIDALEAVDQGAGSGARSQFRRRCSARCADGKLYVRKSDSKVFIADEAGGDAASTDPRHRRECRRALPRDELSKIRINNRPAPRHQGGGRRLRAGEPDPAKRLEAAQAVLKSRDASALPAIDEALAQGDRSAREGRA